MLAQFMPASSTSECSVDSKSVEHTSCEMAVFFYLVPCTSQAWLCMPPGTLSSICDASCRSSVIHIFVYARTPLCGNCSRYAIPAEATLEVVDGKRRARARTQDKEKQTRRECECVREKKTVDMRLWLKSSVSRTCF